MMFYFEVEGILNVLLESLEFWDAFSSMGEEGGWEGKKEIGLSSFERKTR